MPRMKNTIREQLEKARSAALSAVENYNKPGSFFRTRTYTVLITIAWTALYHAIFFKKGIKPWYVKSGSGKGTRYVKVDGDYKYWELSECINRYHGSSHPPDRGNLEFLLKLRNKIEHRHFPELDPALYGECQASLMNFEDMLLLEFGTEYALADSLSVSLQFTSLRPQEQKLALRRLQKSKAKGVLEFIEHFRAGLPPEVLESSRFSLKLFLIPKLANRKNAADLAVEFVPYDPTRPEEMNALKQVAAIIKEKAVPIASQDLLKPGQVVELVAAKLPFTMTMHTHTSAWRFYRVRPAAGDPHPERTKADFCIYDYLMEAYGYTKAWVKFLIKKLDDPKEYQRVTGKKPKPRKG